jgi:hypothetical protein
MRLKSLSITAGALAILAAGLAPLAFHPDATQAASSAKQDLSGTWVLDKSKSDKPPEGRGGMGMHGGHGGYGQHAGGEMGPPPRRATECTVCARSVSSERLICPVV